jgi:drug/metabolite transporter (DMT)-like permease
MHQYYKGILFTILAAVVWSTGGLFVKLITLDAFTILFYRSFFTAIFFLVVLGKKTLKINKNTLITAIFYAPLMLCFVVSTKMTTAANAIFIQSTGVAYVLILEPLIRKTKLLKIDIATVVFSFIGMMLFFIEGLEMKTNVIGLFIALLSGLASAGMMISQKTNSYEYVPGGILLGNLLVVIITLPWFIKNPIPPSNQLLMLMFLGFVQLGVGFLLFAMGQKYISAIDSALISLLEPILNPVWVMIGYGEIPTLLPVIGGFIILSSLVFRLWWMKHKMF